MNASIRLVVGSIIQVVVLGHISVEVRCEHVQDEGVGIRIKEPDLGAVLDLKTHTHTHTGTHTHTKT